MDQKKNIKTVLSENFLRNKIHKVYLCLALIIGVALSIGMPLFNEPDGQYHYVLSTNMVGLANDISAYGEPSISTGIAAQIPSYQSGNYFQKYYENKIVLMPMKDLPRVSSLPSFSSYLYWGHLIPAIGTWIGYHIYPSMGVMIVIARLLNSFICSLAMFFIIKGVKRGKLLFATIFLSPVVMNQFASLSYDALSFVLAALIMATAINLIDKTRIGLSNLINMLVISFVSLFTIKTNFLILLLFFPLITFTILFDNYRKKTQAKLSRQDRLKGAWAYLLKHKIRVAIIGGIIISIAAFFITMNTGGIIGSAERYLFSLFYNYHPYNTVGNIDSILIQPYESINLMPYWLTSVWFAMIALVILTEDKYVQSPIIAYGSIILFIAEWIAIYQSFMSYNTGLADRAVILGGIFGIQGRYFTPFLLVFSLIFSYKYKKFKIKISSYRAVAISVIIIVILSNSLLLIDTLLSAIQFGI